jgi:1-acyl-sn-glycerol-3-phosphate acyltransferase
MKPKKILYYSDPRNDDFAQNGIEEKPLPEDFTYIHQGPFWRALAFFVYRILATPVGFLASRLWYGVRVHNRKALAQVKGSAFLYINHTQSFHDAYMPILLAWPRKNYVVVSPTAVSAPILSQLVQLLGGIPVPHDLNGLRRFRQALEQRSREGAVITIYPEAHIWPYYTGIRPFPDSSFAYPAKLDTPVFAAVTTYRQRRIFKNARPLIDVTIGGPFYPDKSLPDKKARALLRQQVYDFMTETAAQPGNAAYYEYRKKTESE